MHRFLCKWRMIGTFVARNYVFPSGFQLISSVIGAATLSKFDVDQEPPVGVDAVSRPCCLSTHTAGDARGKSTIALLGAGRGPHAADHRPVAHVPQLLGDDVRARRRDDNSRNKKVRIVRKDSAASDTGSPEAPTIYRSAVPPACAANCAVIVTAHDASGDTRTELRSWDSFRKLRVLGCFVRA